MPRKPLIFDAPFQHGGTIVKPNVGVIDEGRTPAYPHLPVAPPAASVAYPRRPVAYPRLPIAPPAASVAYPRRPVASPAAFVAPPHPGIASPRRPVASPRPGVAPPRRPVASPRPGVAPPRPPVCSSPPPPPLLLPARPFLSRRLRCSSPPPRCSSPPLPLPLPVHPPLTFVRVVGVASGAEVANDRGRDPAQRRRFRRVSEETHRHRLRKPREVWPHQPGHRRRPGKPGGLDPGLRDLHERSRRPQDIH